MLKKMMFGMWMLSALLLTAGTVEVKPENAVILLPEKSAVIQRFAAQELKKHLELVSGKTIPVITGNQAPAGKYPFYVGFFPPKDSEKLRPEEARSLIAANGTWLYGEDSIRRDSREKISLGQVWSGRTGTLTAVYDFLEKNFGIRWIEPGDQGIVYSNMPEWTFSERKSSWDPGRLVFRQMRSMNPWRFSSAEAGKIAPDFRMTHDEYEKKYADLQTWLKRQRMGRSLSMNYGHAFVDWYSRYHKEHPEWFAMHEDGSRELRGGKEYGAKLCVSNPEVVRKVVSEWARTKSPTINTCENDGGFFCHCPRCLALDARRPGEKLEDHLTDRYLNFTNRVLALAKQQRPDVTAVMYAYSYYRFPPRRETVMPDAILGFVPFMMTPELTGDMYEGWHKTGARKIFLRPNDHHVNTGLPMGFEKSMFDGFQLGMKYGIIGTDYDCIHGFWPSTGIADYILARAHIDPSKPFEYWEEEYCSAFGAAKEEVKNYYRYWRETVWEKRLMPNYRQIVELGKYGNFRRGLMWYLDRYYRNADFDVTDGILKTAASRSLTSQERERIELLRLANRHARLSFLAMTAKGNEKFRIASELYQLRRDNRDRLNMEWSRLLQIEQNFGDVAGVNAAASYRMFREFRPLPSVWRFELDPADIGLKEQWEQTGSGKIQTVWEPIQTDRPWESQTLEGMHPALKQRLKNYDGVGWYGVSFSVDPKWKGSEISLSFGAVDESAWIWVNGKKAGERLYRNSDDWKNPFTIRIDSCIDWRKPRQTVVVRVHDSGGQGGIWKPVVLVRK